MVSPGIKKLDPTWGKDDPVSFLRLTTSLDTYTQEDLRMLREFQDKLIEIRRECPDAKITYLQSVYASTVIITAIVER
jgi:hypothetical protein